jgi:pantetheine-phosphate adenylyltransferase
VIERASGLFDRLVVGIGESTSKTPLFPLKERLELVAEICSGLKNVEVKSFTGLAVDFAEGEKAQALIRGLRSSADYNYEMQMALMNRAMAPDLETLFIPTSPQFSHISSSLAKEIALHGGKVNLLVPTLVSKKLAEKFQS